MAARFCLLYPCLISILCTTPLVDRPAAARWLPIDGGVDGKDIRVQVCTYSCGSAALGCWSYAARLVRGIIVVERVCPQRRLFVLEVFFGAPTYHQREFIITAEVTDSDCQT